MLGLPCQPTTGDSGRDLICQLHTCVQIPHHWAGRPEAPGQAQILEPGVQWLHRKDAGTALIICCHTTLEEFLSFWLLLITVGINNHPGKLGRGAFTECALFLKMEGQGE